MDQRTPKFIDNLASCLSTTKLGNQRTESQRANQNSISEKLVAQQKPLPSSETETRDCRPKPTELHPKFEEKRRMYHIKQKTLLKIYLSKWWYEGLEFEEKELLLLLGQSMKLDFSFLHKEIYEASYSKIGKRTVYLGGHSSNQMEIPNENMDSPAVAAINLIGEVCFAGLFPELSIEVRAQRSYDEVGEDIFNHLYNLTDFHSVWKLRSFQSLRDSIFVPFKMKELGVKGYKRNRIRGYTDGRGSAGDPTRTKMARQLDVVFWSEKYEQRWKEFHEHVESMAGISKNIDGTTHFTM